MTTPNPGKSAARKRSSRRARWIAVGVCAVIVVLTAAFALPLALSGAPTSGIVRIPTNATTASIHDSIASIFGEQYASKVMKVLSTQKVNWGLRHGAYEIPEGLSPLRASRRLTNGAQAPVKVTINNFRGLPVLAERVSAKLDFTPDSLLHALSNPALLSPYGLTPDNALALFIDDTYEFYWSSSPETLVAKIGANYNKVWNQERREKAAKLGLTPAEVTILASITDAETNQKAEKGTVARLYLNRLQRGMKLQSDPTVIFAIGDFEIKRVTSAHTSFPSPYNTYLNAGLPPGPIRTTTTATIDAVLDSAPHDYIYMCAREDFSGFHNFSSNYADHMANARRYQQALDTLGIR